MEIGDLVNFPASGYSYQLMVGVLIDIRDNPVDVDYRRNPCPPVHPRQVADVMFEGKVHTCWASSLRSVHASR